MGFREYTELKERFLDGIILDEYRIPYAYFIDDTLKPNMKICKITMLLIFSFIWCGVCSVSLSKEISCSKT